MAADHHAAPSVAPSSVAAPVRRGDFLLVSCRGGAEAAVVERQQQLLPGLRKAAWRRGLVTFRLGGPAALADPPDDFFPDLVFARSCVRSLGQVSGGDDAERAAKTAELVGGDGWQRVHVWRREPGSELPVDGIRGCLRTALGVTAEGAVTVPGDLVLDCVLDSPERWWIGWHRAAAGSSVWPGGLYPAALPATAVSRAWLKLDEAIALFGVPLVAGQRAVELGSAPGGASQRLLEAGLEVVGVDPALVDPRVAAHPRFRQWRMRARDVKLREFRPFDWIVCDMNIDPISTMEALGRVVTATGVRPRGIIATLKLPEWSRARSLPEWLDAFRGWGFEPTARQLSTGGREVCVVARRLVSPARARRHRGA